MMRLVLVAALLVPRTVKSGEPAGPSASKFAAPQLEAPCATCGPATSGPWGIACPDGTCCRSGQLDWSYPNRVPFDQFAHGQYVGEWRTAHVPEYRLRVDDQLEFVYRVTRDEQTKPYELNVGDEIRIESFTDKELNRDLIVQPDGTITLRLLGQIRATRHTVAQLREELDKAYLKYYKVPSITVTPLKMNTKLEDLRATVDSRAGSGGQRINTRITPEGTISLPALVGIPAQGLTLRELKREIDARYAEEIEGIEVTPVLTQRAPRFVYVLGEVNLPGRYTLEGPTTVMQALALAGSWRNGAKIGEIVIFRRGQDWRLVATRVDLRQALLGKRPCPADEIWVADSDLIIVPKSPIKFADDFIELVFTKGLYGVVPFQGVSINMAKLGGL